ncbi:MAG: hypothetical protein ACXWQO_09460 [Bdellovibrionota bacterium]
MKLALLLLLIPALAIAKGPQKAKVKTRLAHKRVATKISSGKQVCQMIEKMIKAGIPHQTEVDLPVGQKLMAEGKVGLINQATGTFHIANLFFRAYAAGKEDRTYEEKCLSINFPDLNGDGIKDLEVKTTINKIEPGSNPPKATTEAYERTFLYNPEHKGYEPASGSPNSFVELLIL